MRGNLLGLALVALGVVVMYLGWTGHYHAVATALGIPSAAPSTKPSAAGAGNAGAAGAGGGGRTVL